MIGIVLGPVVLTREYKAEKLVSDSQVQVPPCLIIRGELPLWWSSFFLINFPIFLNQESKLFTPPIRTDWQAFNGIEGLAEEEAFSTRTMGGDPEAD